MIEHIIIIDGTFAADDDRRSINVRAHTNTHTCLLSAPPGASSSSSLYSCISIIDRREKRAHPKESEALLTTRNVKKKTPRSYSCLQLKKKREQKKKNIRKEKNTRVLTSCARARSAFLRLRILSYGFARFV